MWREEGEVAGKPMFYYAAGVSSPWRIKPTYIKGRKRYNIEEQRLSFNNILLAEWWIFHRLRKLETAASASALFERSRIGIQWWYFETKNKACCMGSTKESSRVYNWRMGEDWPLWEYCVPGMAWRYTILEEQKEIFEYLVTGTNDSTFCPEQCHSIV